MNMLNSLKSKLKPLGLYDLSNTSLISAELSAYAKGLDLLNDEFEELEKECFISTSSSYGLDLRESLFGYSKENLTLSQRREGLLYRQKITSNDYSALKIAEAAKACGIDGYIVEKDGTMQFDFNCNDNFETASKKQEAIDEVGEFLPAHLTCTFDFRDLSWDKIAANDYTFAYMDSQNLTWNQIDI